MSAYEIDMVNDARRASDLAEAGERAAADQYRRGMQINAVTAAIRKCDLDLDGIRQILSTLACSVHDQKVTGYEYITGAIEATLGDLE